MLRPIAIIFPLYIGFPNGSDGKASAHNAGRPGFNPWVGKIPWRRKWQPTPVSNLAWKILWTGEPSRPTVHGVTKSQTQLSDFTFTSPLYISGFYFQVLEDFEYLQGSTSEPLRYSESLTCMQCSLFPFCSERGWGRGKECY